MARTAGEVAALRDDEADGWRESDDDVRRLAKLFYGVVKKDRVL